MLLVTNIDRNIPDRIGFTRRNDVDSNNVAVGIPDKSSYISEGCEFLFQLDSKNNDMLHVSPVKIGHSFILLLLTPLQMKAPSHNHNCMVKITKLLRGFNF